MTRLSNPRLGDNQRIAASTSVSVGVGKEDSSWDYRVDCNDKAAVGVGVGETRCVLEDGSVGNGSTRRKALGACRSLGGPTLPVLTLLGSISREAKQ